ncbi:MAG: transposase, partial [Gammaproteobacteria bacterium]|nr:transposase [Gammaproteobacteria bacterium]
MMQLVLGRLVWIMAPGLASNAGDSRARWKVMTIDALTYFLFALMIRSSHPLRKIFFAVDWQTIDERCAAVYENGRLGAPAYPPQVLFRIMALMFLSGTPFDSATLLRLETDMAWRWFAGLSLWGGVPNAGTLTHFRGRLGTELFEAVLTDLIKACDEAGLIGHEESYYDMTGVEASATQA